MTTFLAAQIQAAGKTPFLHVKSENGARVVYQKIGFRLRTAICLTVKQAGLTVGGFYKHFGSRDELVAEAMRSALGRWKRKMEAAASGGPPVTYESLVDDYLSEAHRDHPATGYPVGALAGDIARTDKQTRALVTQEAQDSIKLLANLLGEREGRTAAQNGRRQSRRAARSSAPLAWLAQYRTNSCRANPEDRGTAAEESCS